MAERARYVSDYPVFYVTADLVVLTVRDGRLCVLLVTRRNDPYAGHWALPGGFTDAGEDVEDAAYRELEEEAGLGRGDVALEQLHTFGAPDRDPRFRVVSVAHLALGADLREPVAGDDAGSAAYLPVDEALGPDVRLAFDHHAILTLAVERARQRLERTGAAAAFCPPEFTVAQLRAVHEAVWGQVLDPEDFARRVTAVPGFLVATGGVTEEHGRAVPLHRADPGVVFPAPLGR
jgi:8-oxo-dGTP diphosphatase